MLTVTLQIANQKMDIMVRQDQRIADVLRVLKENQKIFFQIERIVIYSVRKKMYVNQLLTFKQANIYSGDILILK